MTESRVFPHPRPLAHCDGRGEPTKRGAAGWRRLRLVSVAAGLIVVLGGCTFSPETSRVPGEPGADVGNHGNPIELLAPPDRFDRIYADTPYDGPRIAKPDTSQS